MLSCFSKSMGYRTFHKLDDVQTYAVVKGDGIQKTALLSSAIELLLQDKAIHKNDGSNYTVLGTLVQVLTQKLSAENIEKCELPVCRLSNLKGETFGDVFDKLALSAHWPLFRLPVIPRGLQKLLAAAYILDKGEAAFDAQGKFKVNQFLTDDKIPHTLRCTLKASYFENIHKQGKDIVFGKSKDAYAACKMQPYQPPVAPLELFGAMELEIAANAPALSSENRVTSEQAGRMAEIEAMAAEISLLNIAEDNNGDLLRQEPKGHSKRLSRQEQRRKSTSPPPVSRHRRSQSPSSAPVGPSGNVLVEPETLVALAVPSPIVAVSSPVQDVEHLLPREVKPKITFRDFLKDHPLFKSEEEVLQKSMHVNLAVFEQHVQVALDYLHSSPQPAGQPLMFHTAPLRATDKPPTGFFARAKDMMSKKDKISEEQKQALAQFRDGGGKGLFVLPMIRHNGENFSSFYLDIIDEKETVYSIPLFSSKSDSSEDRKDCLHALFLVSGQGLIANNSRSNAWELKDHLQKKLQNPSDFSLRDPVPNHLQRIFTPNKNTVDSVLWDYHDQVFKDHFIHAEK